MKIHKKFKTLVALVLIALSCIPLASEAAKKSLKPRTAEALEVDKFFWEVFNGGQYEKIPDILEALTSVYFANPDDYITASHIAWTYAWHAAEQGRLETAPPTLINDFSLSKKYFSRAVLKNPKDVRYLNGAGVTTMTEAMFHNEPEAAKVGWKMMLKAERGWPEFNLLTDSYFLGSRLDKNDPDFKRGLEKIWKNMDICIGRKMDRNNPDMTPFMYMKTTVYPKSACWNADSRTPHNFEGFFLHFGDMLVKSGDWQTGIKIYENAKLTPEYHDWKYKDLLETRIKEAEQNTAAFNEVPPPGGRVKNPVMGNSKFACMACHEK